MADSKISGLTALTSGHATGDLVELVDISDTTMAATGTNKKTTLGNLFANAPAIVSATFNGMAISTSTGTLTLANSVTNTFTAEDSGTNTVLTPATVRRTSSGTPANGIGVGLSFEVETATDNIEIGACIQAVTTDVTAATEDFDLVVKTMKAGAAAAEAARFLSYGGLQLPQASNGNYPSFHFADLMGFRQHNTTSRIDVTYGNNGFVSIKLSTGFITSLNHGYFFSSDNPIPTSGAVTLTSGLTSPAAGVISVTDGGASGGALSYVEVATAPTAIANSAVSYAIDDGSGNTRWNLRFPSGNNVYFTEALISQTATGGLLNALNGTIIRDATVEYLRLGSNQLSMNSDTIVGWTSSTTSADAGSRDAALRRKGAALIEATNGTNDRPIGFIGGGSAVASATALPLPTGRVFHVTGTTTITSITSTNFQAGVVITLIFDGALTFTDGNNLKLSGDFTTTADDTITLVYDGTNWYETSRSVN